MSGIKDNRANIRVNGILKAELERRGIGLQKVFDMGLDAVCSMSPDDLYDAQTLREVRRDLKSIVGLLEEMHSQPEYVQKFLPLLKAFIAKI